MSLAKWQENGWLQAHKTSRQEIGGLLAIVERDLHDSVADDLSPDWRLNIAYNAALQSAKAALAASGYLPGKAGNAHYHTLQTLSLTIGLDAKTVSRLDAFRKRRNSTEYDTAGITSDDEAREMHELARDISERVRVWLKEHHSHLLK